MEEREEGAASKAGDLVAIFESSFYRIEYSLHPHGLPNEVPGKSSNENWAAKQACHQYRGDLKENVVITVMDGEC